MMSKRIALKVFSLIFIFLTFYVSPSSWALVLGPEMSVFNFRFNNPGARSNAMGGAFIGLADDATAAFTNPAGLTILTKPEISAEYKYGEITTVFNDSVDEYEHDVTLSGLSFLSYVHPMEKTSFAVFRHQLFKQEANVSLIVVPPFTSKVDLDMEAVTYGISVGHEMADTFSLGLSVGFDQLDWNMIRTGDSPFHPSYPDPYQIYTVNDTCYAEHFTASVLWNPFGELNLGLVYRMGPEFETTYTHYLVDINGNYPLKNIFEQTLKVPDVWGIGISYRFFSNFTAALDVNYVEYSDLFDDVRDYNTGDDISDDYSMDDYVEIHIGLEYIFDINKIPFAVRAGYYYLPDKTITYSGTNQFLKDSAEETPDTEDHIFSLGFGTVFNNFQIDVAGVVGDFIKEVTLSLVYRFE